MVVVVCSVLVPRWVVTCWWEENDESGQSSTLNGKAGRDAQGNKRTSSTRPRGLRVTRCELRVAGCRAAAGTETEKADVGCRHGSVGIGQCAMGAADSGRWAA